MASWIATTALSYSVASTSELTISMRAPGVFGSIASAQEGTSSTKAENPQTTKTTNTKDNTDQAPGGHDKSKSPSKSNGADLLTTTSYGHGATYDPSKTGVRGLGASVTIEHLKSIKNLKTLVGAGAIFSVNGDGTGGVGISYGVPYTVGVRLTAPINLVGPTPMFPGKLDLTVEYLGVSTSTRYDVMLPMPSDEFFDALYMLTH